MGIPGFELPDGWEQRVLFGSGRVHDLGDELARLGRSRPLVYCSWRRRRSEDFGHLAGGLGVTPRVFEGVEPNVPVGLVAEARRLTSAAEADALISFGGGSAVDLAKAVVDRARREGSDMVHVAVPTTYSGAAAPGRVWLSEGQEPREEPGSRVDLVVLDPSLTVGLPWKPTASTGMAAVAHCWEASASGHEPDLAGRALGALVRLLPTAVDRPQDAGTRSDLLAASYAAGVVHDVAGGGLHDALCHALGSRAGVPYGVANAVLLPHSVRGGRDGGLAAHDAERLVRGLRLPKLLREVGVFDEDLEPAASWAASHTHQRVESALGVLHHAW